MPARRPTSAPSPAPQAPAESARPLSGDRNRRLGGLDGLRAIAVAMVLVYHFFPHVLPGGFLGVDVFFTISGFLITSLLLREFASTARIDLLSFWRRRARRLLPAIALVVLVSTSLALTASRDLLVGIAAQIAGAAFFVTNWVFIARGSDYFARDAPELFRNFWSLGLEEQFYIVLPLLAIVAFRFRSRAGCIVTGVLLALLGAISASYMASLALARADSTRIYFGSDSHSFGLLLGAALAVLLQRSADRTLGKAGQTVSIVVAVLGFGVLGVLVATLVEASAWSFTGGIQLATLASLAIVWAVSREGAWAGRVLDAQPMRWIGERSYGIYLWHWPLLLIASDIAGRFSGPNGSAPGAPSAGSGPFALSAWAPQLATLALTIVFAALSYRYVEQPIRRLGLRGAFRTWLSPKRYTARQRRVAIAVTAVLAIAFPLTGFAVTIAPEHTTSAENILRGKKQLDAERRDGADPSDPPPPSDPGSGTESDSDSKTGSDSKSDSEQGGDGAAGPEGVAVDGRDITAIGDSVMLASYPELSAAFPGIEVDAAVSRGLWAGVDIVEQLNASGALRSVIVVGLGTNGPIDLEALDELKSTAGNRPIVLVNAHAERDWIPSVNAQIEEFAAAKRGVAVARWTENISQEPDALAGDGIHPGSRGGEIYADAVRRALEELSEPGEGIGWDAPRR